MVGVFSNPTFSGRSIDNPVYHVFDYLLENAGQKEEEIRLERIRGKMSHE